ncbi:MAG: nuclear transport factor 2 family protein [Terracidiphilus sp.]
MANTRALIARAYAAFNQRDIDGALALMSENVSWPKASEGGRVVGREEIRACWTRHRDEFDPHVEPIEVIDNEQGKTDVKVHQLVKNLNGDVLSDSEVWHVYTISNGLIDRMDLRESDAGADSSQSAEFSKHQHAELNPRTSVPAIERALASNDYLRGNCCDSRSIRH